MKVKKKNLVVALIILFLSVIEYMMLDIININSLEYHDLLKSFSIIICANLVVQIIALKSLSVSLMSPVLFFVIFAYMFHFGQLLMENIYEYDYLNYIEVYMKRDMTALITTLQVSLNSINALFLGILLYFLLRDRQSSSMYPETIVHVDRERQVCNVVGKCLFVISTPFRLLIDVSQMIAAVRFGYSGAIGAISMPGVFSAIASFWYASILLLYVGKKNKRIFWIGIAYTVLTMLTGNRGHQITNILVMIMVYVHYENIKPQVGKIIKYGFLGYIMLIFIDMIMSFRSVGIQGFLSDIGFYLSQSLKSNIIFETIGSFGETLFTPYLVIKQMGNQINPFFCEALIYSFGTLIPDIGGLTSYTNKASNFAKMLDTQNAIGGSFIGDLYYNLRGGYWIGAILVGWLLCKYSVRYKDCMKNQSYSKLIYLIPIFTNVFWWVRDSIGNEMRPLVWQIAFSFLIVSILREKNKY